MAVQVGAFLLSDRVSTERFGRTLGALLLSDDVVALIGDLGTGKTTLTQAIARGMGIAAPVTSPTFALVWEYPGPIPLFHFDVYRLDNAEDVRDLGFEEYFERGGVVIIEWADRIAPLLPEARLTLTLQLAETVPPLTDLGEEAPRLLHVEAEGARPQTLLQELKALLPDLMREEKAT